MTILDVLGRMNNFTNRVQVCYYPPNYAHSPTAKEERSQIMQVGNITYRHIDHWTFKKEVWSIIPCVDKKGEPYLFIQLRDTSRNGE